jgi:hypothetical protein
VPLGPADCHRQQEPRRDTRVGDAGRAVEQDAVLRRVPGEAVRPGRVLPPRGERRQQALALRGGPRLRDSVRDEVRADEGPRLQLAAALLRDHREVRDRALRHRAPAVFLRHERAEPAERRGALEEVRVRALVTVCYLGADRRQRPLGGDEVPARLLEELLLLRQGEEGHRPV